MVEPQYDDGVMVPYVEHVQCLIPGGPDNPAIWLRAIESNEFVIEWGEPRLYGVKCAGYQARICATSSHLMIISYSQFLSL